MQTDRTLREAAGIVIGFFRVPRSGEMPPHCRLCSGDWRGHLRYQGCVIADLQRAVARADKEQAAQRTD